MTNIKVIDKSTLQGIRLDNVQVEMVENELKRILPNFVPVDVLLNRTAADCDMVITRDGQTPINYQIIGRSVLVDVDAKAMAQFYMGLLILEWLHK
jgi:hypothetical protein